MSSHKQLMEKETNSEYIFFKLPISPVIKEFPNQLSFISCQSNQPRFQKIILHEDGTKVSCYEHTDGGHVNWHAGHSLSNQIFTFLFSSLTKCKKGNFFFSIRECNSIFFFPTLSMEPNVGLELTTLRSPHELRSRAACLSD